MHQEPWVRSLGQEDPLEKEMATCSRILAWETLQTEEPGGLQSMGSQKSWTSFSNQTTTYWTSKQMVQKNMTLRKCVNLALQCLSHEGMPRVWRKTQFVLNEEFASFEVLGTRDSLPFTQLGWEKGYASIWRAVTHEISFLCFRYILFSTMYFFFFYCIILPSLGLAMAYCSCFTETQ